MKKTLLFGALGAALAMAAGVGALTAVLPLAGTAMLAVQVAAGVAFYISALLLLLPATDARSLLMFAGIGRRGRAC